MAAAADTRARKRARVAAQAGGLTQLPGELLARVVGDYCDDASLWALHLVGARRLTAAVRLERGRPGRRRPELLEMVRAAAAGGPRRDGSGNYPLLTALVEEEEEVARKRVELWNHALWGACEGGHLSVAQWAVEQGARDWDGALRWARAGGHRAVAQWLEEQRARG